MSAITEIQSRQILVIEDNPDDSTLIGAVLRRASFSVDVASTLAEARSMLRAGSYDLMLSDLGFPTRVVWTPTSDWPRPIPPCRW